MQRANEPERREKAREGRGIKGRWSATTTMMALAVTIVATVAATRSRYQVVSYFIIMDLCLSTT